MTKKRSAEIGRVLGIKPQDACRIVGKNAPEMIQRKRKKGKRSRA